MGLMLGERGERSAGWGGTTFFILKVQLDCSSVSKYLLNSNCIIKKIEYLLYIGEYICILFLHVVKHNSMWDIDFLEGGRR